MQYSFFARRTGNKKWRLILQYRAASGDWKQISKGGYPGRSHALADSEKKALLESVNLAIPIDQSLTDVTFSEFVNIFVKDKKGTLANNTILSYQSLLGYFKSLQTMALRDIVYPDVLNSVKKDLDVYAPKTQQLAVSVLKILFKYAISPYKIISSSPADNLILPRIKAAKPEIRALTADQFSHLLKSLRTTNPRVYVICAIAGYAGLRCGEILGLKWEDIDTENNLTITVSRQWVKTDGLKMDMGSLKTRNSARTVPIPAALAKIFKKYKKDCKVMEYDHRIFHSTTRNEYINRIIKRYIPDASIHTLRHTYATRLLANGVNIKTVAALLGDTVNTVINTYIHYTDDLRDQAAEAVRNIF